MRIFKSINPFNQSLIAEHELINNGQIENKLERAEQAFEVWKISPFSNRSELLHRVATKLRENKEYYASIISLEMGKILNESRAEIEKCALTCDYYADHGEGFLKDELIASSARKSLVSFQPIGAIFAIMPWNFPFWQVFRFAAPATMTGNVILLKHAPNVTCCAIEIEKIFKECGAVEGLFQCLIVDIDVTEKIIAHNIVQGITLTGSEFAGSSVASLAGKHIKKSVMELGGSDPLIVLEDADLSKAAKIALQSRMQNAGQSCIAAKRFIVLGKIKDAFLQKLIEGVQNINQGNPLEESTTMGPIARQDLAEKLENQQKVSIQDGAIVITGGTRQLNNFQPTLLDHVQPGMPSFDEELFGPIASIIEAKNEREAVSLANRNRYGLGASIWTKDQDRGLKLARDINAGNVFINALVKSDPRLPFGGIKKSGYGRELSKYGMHEFTNIKSIFMDE
ncbi:MAG: NAD-dependent succinate-semialdehyde dehydrogenase [Chitinophagales bacterium]|nr:NAD-dependent succinate-semialdehyde dehydrogenase [Chitinophagales bacterium]